MDLSDVIAAFQQGMMSEEDLIQVCEDNGISQEELEAVMEQMAEEDGEEVEMDEETYAAYAQAAYAQQAAYQQAAYGQAAYEQAAYAQAAYEQAAYEQAAYDDAEAVACVEVPEGAQPGDILRVVVGENGEEVEIQVPPDAQPGDQLEIPIPAGYEVGEEDEWKEGGEPQIEELDDEGNTIAVITSDGKTVEMVRETDEGGETDGEDEDDEEKPEEPQSNLNLSVEETSATAKPAPMSPTKKAELQAESKFVRTWYQRQSDLRQQYGNFPREFEQIMNWAHYRAVAKLYMQATDGSAPASPAPTASVSAAPAPIAQPAPSPSAPEESHKSESAKKRAQMETETVSQPQSKSRPQPQRAVSSARIAQPSSPPMPPRPHQRSRSSPDGGRCPAPAVYLRHVGTNTILKLEEGRKLTLGRVRAEVPKQMKAVSRKHAVLVHGGEAGVSLQCTVSHVQNLMWLRQCGGDASTAWLPLAKGCSSAVGDGTVIALLLPKESTDSSLHGQAPRPFVDSRLPVELVYEVWGTRPSKVQLPLPGELRYPLPPSPVQQRKQQQRSPISSPRRQRAGPLHLDTGMGMGRAESPQTTRVRGEGAGTQAGGPGGNGQHMSPSAQRLRAWRERHQRRVGSPGPTSPAPGARVGSPHVGRSRSSSPYGSRSFGSPSAKLFASSMEDDQPLDPALLDVKQGLRSNRQNQQGQQSQNFSPRRGTPAEPIW